MGRELQGLTIVGLIVCHSIVQVAAGQVQGCQPGRVGVLNEAVVEEGLVVALAHLVVGMHQLQATAQNQVQLQLQTQLHTLLLQ